MRDRLVAGVLQGDKTATTSLLAEREADREPLPAVGERRTVIDSEDRPVATMEFTAVDVIRLGDADLDLVLEEGEGFESVAEWRQAHERFWRDEVIPKLPRGLADPLTDDTQIIVERFRLVSTA
jgi:uncharacterized protein YhfF